MTMMMIATTATAMTAAAITATAATTTAATAHTSSVLIMSHAVFFTSIEIQCLALLLCHDTPVVTSKISHGL